MTLTMNRFLFLLCIGISTLLSSCNTNHSSPPHPHAHSQIARININSEPPTLDPRVATDGTSATIIRMLFDGLTRINPQGVTELSVAKEVTISPDQKTYTFILRDSVWSNGDPVTAEDFASAWKKIIDPTFAAEFAYQLYVIKNAKEANKGTLPLDSIGIHAVDDKTLVVELENPTPYFLDMMSHHIFFPVHRRIANTHPEWPNDAGELFIGNGPFILTEWAHSDAIVVEKNPLYWDVDQVQLESIHVSMIENAATELHMFENGEIDWAGKPLSMSLPVDAIPHLREKGLLHVVPVTATYHFQFNTHQVPFNNTKIRKAFSYAIGRQQIIDNITQTDEIPAMGFVPPTMDYEHQPFFEDENLAEAQNLFQEGLEELKLTPSTLPPITLTYNTGEHHLKIAQAIQQQWNSAFGIQIELVTAEWKVYLNMLQHHEFMVARLSWGADFNDPISFLDVFKYASEGSNHTYWEDPKYVELLDKSMTILDPIKRQKTLLEAEKLLMDAMPFAPVYFMTFSYVKNEKLQNAYLSPLGLIDFKWGYFD